MSTTQEEERSVIDILTEAIQQQTDAEIYMKQGKYDDAIPLLIDALETRAEYVNKPPYIHIIDVAILYLKIGIAHRAMNRKTLALENIEIAYSLYFDRFGCEHFYTKKACFELVVTSTSSSAAAAA